VKFYMKESEAAGHSGHRYPHPAVHVPDSNIARQLLSATQILRGNWPSDLSA